MHTICALVTGVQTCALPIYDVPVCRPIRTLLIGAKIAEQDVWWDAARIQNGTIWDDPGACKLMLSAQKAAHRTLVEEVRALAKQLTQQELLAPRLRRRLLILSRSEEHTSELQSLMRISYAVFCLKKKKQKSNDEQK